MTGRGAGRGAALILAALLLIVSGCGGGKSATVNPFEVMRVEIDADPDTGHAELEPMLREADEFRSEALRAYADSIIGMRAQMTVEEWSALYPNLAEDE